MFITGKFHGVASDNCGFVAINSTGIHPIYELITDRTTPQAPFGTGVFVGFGVYLTRPAQ
jgi:hypothetical protein